MSNSGPKQILYGHFARVAKALGQSHRLEIIELLAQAEWMAAGLPVQRVGVSFGTIEVPA